MLNTNQKIEHLRKLGFNGDFEQIERMYNGENLMYEMKNIVGYYNYRKNTA